jgi:hypothetical protein
VLESTKRDLQRRFHGPIHSKAHARAVRKGRSMPTAGI